MKSYESAAMKSLTKEWKLIFVAVLFGIILLTNSLAFISTELKDNSEKDSITKGNESNIQKSQSINLEEFNPKFIRSNEEELMHHDTSIELDPSSLKLVQESKTNSPAPQGPSAIYRNFSYTELLRYDDDGSPSSVYVVSDTLYLADGDYGLKIFNISTISNPVELGRFYDGSGEAKDVVVNGNYAYIADGYDGLEIVNIADPSNPYEVGQYDGYYSADGIEISGSIAYLIDSGYELIAVNIANPSNPYELGYYDDSYGGIDIALNYPYVYVAHSFGFLCARCF
jgi:hypothetical protein